MTDLILINPPSASEIYGALADDGLTALEPPLWCRLIAGYVRDRGFSVKIIDAEALGFSPKQAALAAISLSDGCKLICIPVYGHQPSASTQQMIGAGALCRELKAIDIAAPVLMVGGHPSALPSRTLAEEIVDYVGVGEGVWTVEGLLRGDDIAIIPGLVWRDGSIIRINAPAPNIEDMKQLHGDVLGSAADESLPCPRLAVSRRSFGATALCLDSHVAQLPVQVFVLLYLSTIRGQQISDA